VSEIGSLPPVNPTIVAKLAKQFRHIRKFRDSQRDVLVAQILPGEYYVTAEDELISTVLGSCISACIRDAKVGIGGMNHFMLPTAKGEDHELATRYGTFAMEHLINDILQHGGSRKNLEVKIFGGGKISPGMRDVGADNIAFAKEFLATEEIPIVSEDVGLVFPRKVNYFARTGKVMIKKLRSLHTQSVVDLELQYSSEIKTASAGDVELFG
jgi:chemotaxis protein CheD